MKTLEEINKIREEKRKELDLRVNVGASTHEKHIFFAHVTFYKCYIKKFQNKISSVYIVLPPSQNKCLELSTNLY